jgi:hypothetical protein
MLHWTILLRIPLIIVVSLLRMPNRLPTKKTCLSIQWVVTSKGLTNYNHCCLTWANKVKAIVLKLVSMKSLAKSATFLDVLQNEFFLLKIEIHPDKLWFNESCLEKRNQFRTPKIRYSFVKNKENRDVMKKHVKNLSRKWNKAIKIINKIRKWTEENVKARLKNILENSE